ncbi:MAG TPA: GFA family protein [Caulobacteraceae bacterium]
MSQESLHQGACHCGAVAYEATLSLEGVIECNCSHCYAKGFQLAFVTPDKFTLKQGEDALSPEYLFNTHKIRHRFCARCGVEAFASGEGPGGQKMVAINVRTLTDVEPWSVETARFDGRGKL